MRKRADWKLIKNLGVTETVRTKFAEMPLVDVRNIDPRGAPKVKGDDLEVFLDSLPATHFNLLLSNGIMDQDLILTVHVNETSLTFEIITNNNSGGINLLVLLMAPDAVTYHTITTDKHFKILSKKQTNDPNFVNLLDTTTLLFIRKMVYLATADLYPVEVQRQPASRATHQATKSFKREDLVSIVYMNKLPDTRTHEAQGGTHASPVAHPRSGFNRVLKDPRFKNHKDYMKPRWIKPTWVGKETEIVNGRTYKVLLKKDNNHGN